MILFVNGKFCKDPKLARAEDFFFSGLDKPGNTANRLGVDETDANVEQIPGLNTLGISAFRIDYAPYGQRPPHIHPHASEILLVLEGTLHVGFVTSDQLNNKLIAQVPKTVSAMSTRNADMPRVLSPGICSTFASVSSTPSQFAVLPGLSSPEKKKSSALASLGSDESSWKRANELLVEVASHGEDTGL
ncbi:hypothetical protein WN944_016369 [Citrus x changshan-huyou]|uniref:Cupin type-1 domain-containing protein n=1 Tax=Citrus x changshan-huyou TaxID=2935761 RepID=A0AAP0QKB8_9ROSI